MDAHRLRKFALVVVATVLCLTTLVVGLIKTFPVHAASPGPALTVDAAANQHAIDSAIYGMAQYQLDAQLQSELKLPSARWGGDGTTTYNWLQDAYTTASYADFISGTGVANPTPSGQVDALTDSQLKWGGSTVVTVPLIGYVTKSSLYNCSYLKSQYPPQWGYFPYIHPNGDDCGNGKELAEPHKQLVDTNLGNNYIPVDSTWMKEWIKYLTNKYGAQAASKIIFQMDNEPENWLITQFDIHPDPTGFDEIVNKTLDYAGMIKSVDPTAKVMGPSNGYPYGYVHMGSNSKAGDNLESHNMAWIPYYLQAMSKYEQQKGIRPLDYLDVHFYGDSSSEDPATENTDAANAARLDSTRALWDPTYNGDSALNKYIPGENPTDKLGVIGELKRWIDQYYPGTKLSISEYDFGNHDHINGALTQADVLGIFGREGLSSAQLFFDPKSTDPAAYTYRMYLNYDGNGGHFGDTSVQASSADQGKLSIYASRRSSDNALTLMLVNKTGEDLTSTVNLNNFAVAGNAQVYSYGAANLSSIVHQPDVAVSGNSINTTYAANSITTLIIPASGTQPTPTPTTVVTPTPTPTGGDVTLNPTADRDNYASHNGTENRLDISQYQTAYLKFDISSASSVNTAHFRVYRDLASQGAINVTALQVGDSSWTESSNNLPAVGDVISTQSSPGSGYVDFDVSSYIKAAKASGSNLVTLAVKSDTSGWQDLDSRESDNNKPQLVISTTSTPTGGTLTPTADRDNYASHNGTENRLDISQYQTAYLKFDISSIGSVNTAHFKVYRDLASQGVIHITALQVGNSSWTESSNNLPEVGDVISTQMSPASGYVDFDVSSYIKAAKASGSNVVTLAVSSDTTGWQDLDSRESDNNKPQLIIS
ncbi:hypothetical protein KDA_05690 [Dictyobacter alpinus]|uniref:Uncharacterized protein n=1 Tax=Dictyobacter alpinus TaxID=2014873 RepID=A0A402B147_9CHLR|nr:glycoside hydrolase family 44 protein [Dictyobacter alpinus]GCE25085.1 hypothetical protein KDA_05690 [Dictyobacter alpinus]